MKRFKSLKEQEKYNLMTSNKYSSDDDNDNDNNEYSSDDDNDYIEIRKGILSNSKQEEEYYIIPNGIKGGDYFTVLNNKNQLCWVKCPYFKDEGDKVSSFETEIIVKNNDNNNNNEMNFNIFSFNLNKSDMFIYYGKPTNGIVLVWIMMEFILFISLVVVLSIQTWSIMTISNECPSSYPNNKDQDIYFQLYGGVGNSKGCGNNGALYNIDDNNNDNFCIEYSTKPSSTILIFWQTIDKITTSEMAMNDINYYLPILQYILPAAIFVSLLSCLIHTLLYISKNTTKKTAKFLSLLGMFILFICEIFLLVSIILSNSIDIFNSSYWTKLYSQGYDINYILDYSNSDINIINLKSPENYTSCKVELIDEPSKIGLLWSFIWCLISLLTIIFNGCFGHPFFASCIDDADYLKDYLDLDSK